MTIATFAVPEHIVIINNERFSDSPRWFSSEHEAQNAVHVMRGRHWAEDFNAKEENFIEATRIQECVYEGADGNYYSPLPGADMALRLSGEYLYTPQNTYSALYTSFSDRKMVFSCLPYDLPSIPAHVYHVDELNSLMEQMSELVDSDCEDEDSLANYGSEDAREMAAQQIAINRRCMLEHLHYLADVAAMFWFTADDEDKEEQREEYHNFLDNLMNAIARSM